MDKPTAKQKSALRFQQLNLLVDRVAPTLPTSAHVAVLLCCYRHGRHGGRFEVSTERIATSVRLSKRQAIRIIDDLERLGVITMEQDHRGPIPRRYRITGNVANGDTHVTNKTT